MKIFIDVHLCVFRFASGFAVPARGQKERGWSWHPQDALRDPDAGKNITNLTHPYNASIHHIDHSLIDVYTSCMSLWLQFGLWSVHVKLTATKVGREILKSKNVYPITREFHKWEKDPHVISACEKLVQVMCRFIDLNLKQIFQLKCNLCSSICDMKTQNNNTFGSFPNLNLQLIDPKTLSSG